jgi:DNA-binding HxlR family transcriptional regulator
MKKAQPAECPITKVAKVLSDTWTMLIMHHLITKPMGFCELERALGGISTRTLTLKLIKLCEEKMVVKDREGLYTATERGKGLKMVEKAMMRYQEQYL